MSKRIILPGEKVADSAQHVPNTFIEGGATFAAVVGMLDEGSRFIPLESRYRPTVGDVVVGLVTDSRHAGYDVELGLPQVGFIPARDTRIVLALGDFVVCRIRMIDEVGNVDLGEVRRLPKGKLVTFPPAKVPRLIGKKSSMLLLLKERTGGDLVVGNNGYVWISDRTDIPLLLKAMKLIEKKAHFSGLTDEVAAMLGGPLPEGGEHGTEGAQETGMGEPQGEQYGNV